MKLNRRCFVKSAIGLCGGLAVPASAAKPTISQLDEAASARLLKLDSITSPVRIASIELLRDERNYFIRARSADGAEGIIEYPLNKIVP